MSELREKVAEIVVRDYEGGQGEAGAFEFALDVADEILALPGIKTALAYAPKGTVRNIVTKEGGTVFVPSVTR